LFFLWCCYFVVEYYSSCLSFHHGGSLILSLSRIFDYFLVHRDIFIYFHVCLRPTLLWMIEVEKFQVNKLKHFLWKYTIDRFFFNQLCCITVGSLLAESWSKM
jgi:hypothetical protein